VEKIKQVTYSANAISSLNNTQIQNIIDYVLSKAITGNRQNPKNNQINASDVLDSAKASVSTASIPITQISNSSGDSKGIGPEDLPKSQVSVPFTTSSGQVVSSNKSRPPLSILPDYPEEKRKHAIRLVLERFSYLFFRGRNTYSDGFDLNSTSLCPICNGDHKEKTLSNTISGKWDSGDYYGETTYRLKCWNGFNKGIQIVTVKT
jgi:hypothetical protein